MDTNLAIIAFYALLTIHSASGNSMNSTFKEKIIGFLQELCPRSGVCSNEEIDNKSCCRACSCTPDCYEDNCCFTEKLEDLPNGTIYRPKRLLSQCLYPLSETHAHAYGRVSKQAYYMVTSSPNANSTSMVPCGDRKVAVWGSMYPVRSRYDGTIYKNRVCAEENDVPDWEPLDAYLVCHDRYAGPTVSLYDGTIPETCKVEFEYDAALLKPEICYVGEDYKSFCSADEFDIPEITTASKEEVVAACRSGVLSPYRRHSNVFCSICSRVKLGTCSENDDDYKGTGPMGFTSFIDPNYLPRYDEGETDKLAVPEQNLNSACIVNNDQTALDPEGCRRILCPAGQIYGASNTCIYPGNKWSLSMISLQLDITAEQPFSIVPLFESIKNLKSPFSKGWYLNIVAYWDTNDNNEVKDIIVVQTMEFQKSFKPKSVIERIRKSLMKPWILTTNNGTISLNAKLNGRALYGFAPIYAFKVYNLPVAVPITSLYFCQQVILQPSEYVFNREVDALTNLINNDTVLQLDFSWMDTSTRTSPAICFDTSGLQRFSSSNVPTQVPRTDICLILVLLSKVCQIIFQ